MQYKMEQVSIRMVKEPSLMSDKPITRPENAVEIMGEFLCDLDREMMVVVNLRNDGKPINMNIMSIGTINMTPAVPREALKSSILSNAANVILFHNHPSGKLLPSTDDVKITDRMIKAYHMLGMSVLDHIIIGPDGRFYSMREKDVFRFSDHDYAIEMENLEFPRPKAKDRTEAR